MSKFSTRNCCSTRRSFWSEFVCALLWSVRHAHWGPEGPVGGWLLLVPYLFMAAAVTAALIALGTFSWVPGGRVTCFFIWIGLLIAFAVSGYYSMSESETKYEQFAALSGWLLLAGCFVAVNAAPSIAARTAIVATLGLGGVAGWLQVAVWLSEYSVGQAQLEESKIAHEQEFQEQQEAEFRALGKEAPLWKYFGFMYISNEDCSQRVPRNHGHAAGPGCAARRVRSAAKSSRAMRQDTSASFIQRPDQCWLRPLPADPIWSSRRFRKLNAGSDQISERSYADIRDIIRAATRIQKGGGDLTPQMERWRSYLKGFKNTAELSGRDRSDAASAKRTLIRQFFRFLESKPQAGRIHSLDAMETSCPSPPPLPLSAPAHHRQRAHLERAFVTPAPCSAFLFISPATCSGRSSSGWSSAATRPRSMRTAKKRSTSKSRCSSTTLSPRSFASSWSASFSWPILWVLNAVFVIIASIQASDGKFYRYPMTIRFIQPSRARSPGSGAVSRKAEKGGDEATLGSSSLIDKDSTSPRFCSFFASESKSALNRAPVPDLDCRFDTFTSEQHRKCLRALFDLQIIIRRISG
mgnify:CR=1 FL=1